MIALGIDPGARWTGLAVIDYAAGTMPSLLASRTVDRRDESIYVGPAPEGASKLADHLDLPAGYLSAVTRAARLLAFDRERWGYPTGNRRVETVGVEWLRRPSWRHAGREKPVDPSAVMATAIVLGAIVEAFHDVGLPVERIRPMGNGRLFPLAHYPDPIRTTGAGHDKRRHERSAFDVALMAAQQRSQNR